ncbi:aminotransferase class III-fold pyridoxal phosphate-dependent enzyme [Pseudemcibacter aquimaris]|uniref:aminotransferase class III-fold pyridoxal phosphate-dependent enzyme n=1 Tax=Pseudemcibacter aquimaris TaxID=2857064 RepID=UPI002012A7E7|nr:aminotransferase class III-fold pyridoxal phosphate-dependent enzyme [Pseudemcibacter aquimaris]MCC3859804.1 aminotransferase class III-fold pyridoxal phosphate-dependent enzyme [Pseudemcibacter aquimaris]WDU60198.1 aminotransferase class III-fold pyridoxal phosphate-dependent enzyme [Pseudemcibacter aquimaris]
MGVFESPPPSYDETELLEIAEKYFGKTGKVKPLVSERDQNARLIDGDDEYVIKIANSAEDVGLIEFQNAVLNHVEKLDPELAVPKVIKGKDGNQIYRHGDNNVRLITFLKGDIFGDAPKSIPLYEDLGKFMGRFSNAMQGFGHPFGHQPDFLWNLDGAMFTKQYIDDIEDPENKELIEYFYERYETLVAPRLPKMRSAVIHSDANTYNLVSQGDKISGLIDFGDMLFAKQVNELAVTIGYAVLDVDDVFGVSRALIESYTKEFPLSEDELEVLMDLAAMRLVMSVCISSNRASKATSDEHREYLTVTQAPAFRTLKKLRKIGMGLLTAFARKMGGYDGHANLAGLKESLEGVKIGKLFDFDIYSEPRVLFNNAAGEPGTEHVLDPKAHSKWVTEFLDETESRYGLGNYGENRTSFTLGDGFKSHGSPADRTVHMAVDFWLRGTEKVYAPLDGVVQAIASNDDPFDYGTVLVLSHQVGDGPEFYTLYGHLAKDSVAHLSVGDSVSKGDHIATLGELTENGGWTPHLHFQLMLDMLDYEDGNFPGICEPELWEVWQDVCPHPNLLLGFIPEAFEHNPLTIEGMMSDRKEVLAPSLSVAYKKHIHMVRGVGPYLYDSSGRAFLDCVNNITHVGHCNPKVVEAIQKQAAILNTNSRYLYEGINKLAARVLDTMPDPLNVMFFVNSGSEANELALRLARHYTGRKTTVAVDWGYHGNTNATVAISAYKFNRKGGNGCPPETRLAEFPCPYQGRFNDYSEESGKAYAADVDNQIADLIEKTGEGPAAFIAESIAGVGGQVVYPDGYLKAVYEKIRAAGGLCIADEVQTGVGRTGHEWWAYRLQGVVPDIVSFGKPFGNGHPMAAVVTTREIADRFANGMEYFNSFGGNPVSCAIGQAVFDYVDGEGLREKAIETGGFIMDGMRDMMDRYPLIGQVRGKGMFFGAELVKDRDTKEVAPEEASRIVQFLREDAVLFSTDGPFDNVLKGKPPMVFGMDEAKIFITKLEKAFKRLYAEGF